MTRRGFLARLLGSLVAGATSPACLRAAAAGLQATQLRRPEGGLSTQQWETCAAVQGHLLPSEPGAPGAREIHALGYLRLVLADPRTDAARAVVRQGVTALEQLCRGRYGRSFPALNAGEREEALRAFEKRPAGREWIEEMLGFLLEALLGDPSYGGNPGGVGWKWLGIIPGFPRPPLPRERTRIW